MRSQATTPPAAHMQSPDREFPSAAPCQSAAFAEPIAQGLQQRLLVEVDVDDAAAGVNRKADGGAFGACAFHHHLGVMDDLNRWIKFLDLYRKPHRAGGPTQHKDEKK